MTFHTKLCLVQNHCVLDLIEYLDLLEFMMGFLVLFSIFSIICLRKNMMLFTVELDIL